MSKYKHDLGDNVEKLIEVVQSLGKEKTLVDLGVRFGVSSRALLTNSRINNNKIHGVDILFSPVNQELKNDPNYNFIVGESVTEGSRWHGKVDLVFVDTTHVKEYTMCELFYWWDVVNDGGYIVFHDSAKDYKHTDIIPGIQSSGSNGPLEPVYKAICEFFQLEELLDGFSTEYISVNHYPTSHGMTFIKKIKNYDFKKDISNWDYYFDSRKTILEFLTTNYDFKLPNNTILNLEVNEQSV